MTATISETVSKKRGRPEAFDPLWVRSMANMFPELRSKRQVIAKCYETRAFGVLEGVDGVAAILDRATNTYHATILEQLGRLSVDGIVSDEEVIAAARWVSSMLQSEPTFMVRQAVALIRLLRDEVKGRWAIFGIEHHEPDELLPLLFADYTEVAR